MARGKRRDGILRDCEICGGQFTDYSPRGVSRACPGECRDTWRKQRAVVKTQLWRLVNPDHAVATARESLLRRKLAPRSSCPCCGHHCKLDVGDERHGTVGGYTNHWCRCDDCRAASRAYQAERRAAKRAAFQESADEAEQDS